MLELDAHVRLKSNVHLAHAWQNYEHLLKKISTWLKPNKEAQSGEALLFVHIFCHKDTP